MAVERRSTGRVGFHAQHVAQSLDDSSAVALVVDGDPVDSDNGGYGFWSGRAFAM